MSFTEFSYQLMQGYDFYWLWKNKGCILQPLAEKNRFDAFFHNVLHSA